MRRWAIVLVVVVVPLAGCGLAPGQQPPRADGVTVTPAAVPADEPTPVGVVDVAPGVAPSGAVTPVALAAAHREALRNGSFTRTRTRVISEADATVRRTEWTYWAGQFRETFRYSKVQTLPGSLPVRSFADRIDLYSNGTDAVARFEDDGDVQYQFAPSEEFAPVVTGISGYERVSALSSAFEFEVRPGPTPGSVRLVATSLRTPSALDPPTLTADVRNATLQFLLTEAGLVRSYRLAYDVTLDDRTLHVVETTRITRVGRTTVERPTWFSLAVENATDAVAAPEPDRMLRME